MDDATIRINLIGFIVDGLPSRRWSRHRPWSSFSGPIALAQSQQAARENDDGRLASLVFEAMRFDPLTLGLFRTAA
jgi:hypothetical protein